MIACRRAGPGQLKVLVREIAVLTPAEDRHLLPLASHAARLHDTVRDDAGQVASVSIATLVRAQNAEGLGRLGHLAHINGRQQGIRLVVAVVVVARPGSFDEDQRTTSPRTSTMTLKSSSSSSIRKSKKQ